jgi:Tol biopolymer transport system component
MTVRRRIRALVVLVGVVGGLLGVAGPASGYARPGETATVAQTTAGAPAQCCVYGSAISGDGSRVAFQTARADLVPGGVPGSFDTYVRDFASGVTRRVSVASDGTPAVGSRQYPNTFGDVTNLDLSADGRFVAYTSSAANLVAGDTNGTWDVFVHDLATATTERVSVATGGGELPDGGVSPSISADGRYVAFAAGGLFVHDRSTGTTERVDVSSSGAPANFYGYGPSISDDGRWVAFQSSATNLVTDPSNAVLASGASIYLRDRVGRKTTRVTGPAKDTSANGYSWMPDISGDGRFVAYSSAATDLVPQDTNASDDVFVFDRVSGTTRRVSVASDGTQAAPTGPSHAVAISRDGRFVSFTSTAANLVVGDTNAAADVFVHDLLLGTTERVSDGSPADLSALSDDGAYVALESTGTGIQSVQRRRRGAPISVISAQVSRTASQVTVTGTAGLAGAVVSSVSDAASSVPTVAVPGADVARVELAVRTEAEDLRVRIVTPGLPSAQVSGLAGRLACLELCPASLATDPYVGYRLDFTSAGSAYRLLISAAGSVLSQCDIVCVPLGAGTVQAGVTGQEVVATLPLSLLGGARDQRLTSITAASTLLGSPTGTTKDLDAVKLPNATMPAAKVQVAVVPVGTSPDYTRTAALNSGAFTAMAPATPTDQVAWVRACIGGVCGAPVSRTVH